MYCGDVEGWFEYDDYTAYTAIVSKFHNGNFAEVGCWKGRSFCSIMPTLLANNYQNVYAIDHWKGSEMERDSTHKEATEVDIFPQFTDNLARHGFDGKYNVVRMDSVEASKQFEDAFFDIVFIDGDHTYEGITRDLDAWTSKVKSGGVLCGHDGWYEPIKIALTERFPDRWRMMGGGVWAVEI